MRSATPGTRHDRAGSRRATTDGPGHVAAPAELASTPVSVVLATVGLTVLLALSVATGPVQAAVALGFAGAVLAWGWPVLLDSPNPRVTSGIIGAAAVLIAAATGLTDSEPYLRWVPVALAGGLMAAFFHQLFRRDGRERLTYGMAVTVSGLALASAGAPLAVLPYYPRGAQYAGVAGAVVVVAALVELLGRWAAWRRWMLAVVLAAGAATGAAAAALVTGIPLLVAAFLGVLVAAVSHALRRVLGALPSADALQARMSSGAASVLVVGVVVYLLARVFAGR